MVAEQTRRHVSWMVASKSMGRKFIGAFARAMRGIPVDRPDDMETAGAGFVTVKGSSVKVPPRPAFPTATLFPLVSAIPLFC